MAHFSFVHRENVLAYNNCFSLSNTLRVTVYLLPLSISAIWVALSRNQSPVNVGVRTTIILTKNGY